jgi:hypothetical protein
MKASTSTKRSSIARMARLLCFSLFTGVLPSACADAKEQDPAPQNDTLYALPASVNAEVTDEFQLGAQRVKNGEATNVSGLVIWQSSDEKVVTVDGTGIATATGVGSATINTNYDGHTASVNVKIVGRISYAEVEAATITLAKGTSYKLGTIGIVEDFSKRALRSNQAWGSSKESVAKVSDDGTVTARSVGTATITLTYDGVSYPRSVTVLDVPLGSVTMTPNNGTTVPAGLKTTFKIVGAFGGGAWTQDITNLFEASVPTKDVGLAEASGTAVTALALPDGAADATVIVTVAGAKGSIAESFTQDATLSIIDANTLSSLAISDVPMAVPANGEPFTPSFKGTYGTTIFTTLPALSFSGPTSDDKTKYVEIITGSVYPRLAGNVSIVGTVNVTPSGQDDSTLITASAPVQIVDAELERVTLAGAGAAPTTTVNVGKAIQLMATAEYGAVTQTVTSAVVWVSADPAVAMVANASGAFASPGTVTGVAVGGPVDVMAYYRGKQVGAIAVTVVP